MGGQEGLSLKIEFGCVELWEMINDSDGLSFREWGYMYAAPRLTQPVAYLV